MNAHVVRQGTPTSGSAAVLPTPFLEFSNSFGQPIACTVTEIDLFYNGANDAFTFVVTNAGVQQDVPAPSRTSMQHYTDDSATPGVAARAVPTAADDLTTKVIGMNIDAKNYLYVWNPVNVAPGWYILKASMASTGYTTYSAAFFVYNGTDSSCLFATTASAPNSTATASQIVSLSPSLSPTISPSSRASSKPDTSSIVGSAVAAVVFCWSRLTARTISLYFVIYLLFPFWTLSPTWLYLLRSWQSAWYR